MQKLFYPKFWLDATGFWDSKINTGPDVILFASRDQYVTGGSSSHSAHTAHATSATGTSSAVHLSFSSFLMLMIMTATLSVLGGIYYARAQHKRVLPWEAVTAAHEYIQINSKADYVRL